MATGRSTTSTPRAAQADLSHRMRSAPSSAYRAALARELILLHAERSVRIAGARFRPREDSYQMEEQK